MTPLLVSIPEVLEVTVVRGTDAPTDARPDLVIEVPHGATRTADYRAVEALLHSPLPEGLVDFFHVNTDAGAPELALAVAERFTTAHPQRVAAVLRCRIPRTFIDCNRRVDASPEDFKAGKVTPGLMPWITEEADRALLRVRYDTYVAAVRATLDTCLPTGAALLLHTYAPREVGVEVDENIVGSLHHAYTPEVEPTWPLRPEVDLIGTTPDGTSWLPTDVVETLATELDALGIGLARGQTYPLHPATLAHDHVLRWPGRVLCMEVRRDLLADPFKPFAQMHIGAEKTARLAGPLAKAVAVWWPISLSPR